MAESSRPAIALITDFGTHDWYVGSIKGRILRHCPNAVIEDVTHDVPAGDIHSASYILSSCLQDFPANTIWVCVVDPGVGTERKAIMGRITQYTIICPNNGIISHATRRYPDEIGPFYEILPENLTSDAISATFHGRDIFAPIAGKIASGTMELSDLGGVVSEVTQLPLPKPEIRKGMITGRVEYVDRFGNAITNISLAELSLFAIKPSAAVFVDKRWISLKSTFGEVSPGMPVTYTGSNGYIEIGVNQGHAARDLSLKIGDEVQFYPDATAFRS